MPLPSIHNSDHLCVLFEPFQQRKKTTKKYITTRRFKKSAMQNFGSWITKFNWDVLLRISDVNLKIAYFFSIIWIMIDIFFPSIKIVITENDKKWITSEIKHLIALRQKAHMSGNFDLAKHLAKKIKQEIKKAKINYNTYKAEMFTCSSTKEWYQHITTIINNGKETISFCIIFWT